LGLSWSGQLPLDPGEGRNYFKAFVFPYRFIVRLATEKYRVTSSLYYENPNLREESYSTYDEEELSEIDVHWLYHSRLKQVIGAYFDEKFGCLKEIPLTKCMEIWGEDLDDLISKNKKYSNPVSHPRIGTSSKLSAEIQSRSKELTINIPFVPEKYIQFLKSRRNIMREILTMSKVSGHPNVLKLFKVLELVQDSKSTLFLVLELASSGELFDRIRVDEGCDEITACTYFKQVLDGVFYCHRRGVCHRDLKPENLLLADTEHGSTVLKIADFGLSTHVRQSENEFSKTDPCVLKGALLEKEVRNSFQNASVGLTKLMSVVGSPYYVAPEVLRSNTEGGYDGTKADVWSLGIILYAMLAGNLPFNKDLLQCPRFEEFSRWRRSVSPFLNGTQQIEQNSVWNHDPVPTWFFPRHLSLQVRSFILALLDPEPCTRITVKQAQEHLWIVSNTDTSLLPFSSIHTAEVDAIAPTDSNELEDESLFSDFETVSSVAPSRLRENIESDSEVEDEYDGPIAGMIGVPVTQVDAIRNPPTVPAQDDYTTPCSFRRPRRLSRAPNLFHSPPLAPIHWSNKGRDKIPDLVLGPLCKSPGASSHRLFARGLNSSRLTDESERGRSGDIQTRRVRVRCRSMSPPRRCQSDQTYDYACRTFDPAIDHQENVEKVQKEICPGDCSSGCKSPKGKVPVFNDMVKRSTRFSTAVPAMEVMERLLDIVDGKSSPLKYPSKNGNLSALIDWDLYKVDIMRDDVFVCTVRIFLLTQCVYMVEFIRGQINIFDFKQFYDDIREKLGEIVKNDYTLAMLDSSYCT